MVKPVVNSQAEEDIVRTLLKDRGCVTHQR
nr:MAG TPA: hypothetical protein [Caudoviricetes sp.]DAN17693.1 MAG TPA: hypothetical protein [Caudoviricetes sp.]